MDHTDQSESRRREEMEIHHFSHHHPLVFIKDQSFASEAASCFGCGRSLQGSSYGCTECKYFLHKGCAELELAPEIDHPFHSQHPSTLLPGFPYGGGGRSCDFCYSGSAGFVYHCASCGFDLHVNCALLQSSIAANVPSYLHLHPLFFLENHNKEIKRDCSGYTSYLVQFTTVGIVLILNYLTFIRSVLNYPLRLNTPTTLSILLLSCRYHLLIITIVVAIYAKSSGKVLLYLQVGAYS